MIILVLKLKVSPSDRKNVISIFDTIAGSTSVKPGCKMVKLESDVHDDDDLFLIEEWETMSELERYIASDEFRGSHPGRGRAAQGVSRNRGPARHL